ncbi:hypothetical protein SAMN02910298_02775 [Pseudobutyrivibrio sp. YE44]|nr:hypothetical protein SAMN02910298_02775 [Pseudobutyrivibrio sp. YE44]
MIIDAFFSAMEQVRRFTDKYEKWFVANKRRIEIFNLVQFFVFAIIYIKSRNTLVINIAFPLYFFLLYVENVFGCCKSIRIFLKTLFLYLIGFCFLLWALWGQLLRYNLLTFILTVILYCALWIFISVLADSDVALLGNEIIAGISTTIFSIATFVLALIMKSLPGDEVFSEYYDGNEDALLQAFF